MADEEQSLKWSRAHCAIQERNGTREIPGYVSDDGRWFVHKVPERRRDWNVTHAPSGYSVTGMLDLPTRRDAYALCERLSNGLPETAEGEERNLSFLDRLRGLLKSEESP